MILCFLVPTVEESRDVVYLLIYSIQTVNTCIEKNTFAQTSLCLEGTAPSRPGGPGHLYDM